MACNVAVPSSGSDHQPLRLRRAPGGAEGGGAQRLSSQQLWAGLRRSGRPKPPPSEAEVARAVAEFHARGGRVTLCAPAHALPINNGAGRDASRWTA